MNPNTPRDKHGHLVSAIKPRDYQKYFRRAWTLFLWGAGVENIQAVVTDWVMNDFELTRQRATRHSRIVKEMILKRNKEL